ncbi:unnamed protein product [Cuscuta epithymum]|uniref:SWIM-type domain-containing protein n=2 Tax=Cuscuta epithymum TaxID=186058 RepID=A0AAV0DXY4_9ASTE|nr:unnamed protein product [Cuscuta epithymum]
METDSNDVGFSASSAISQPVDVQTMHLSPGSTMYWTPECDPAVKPCVGMLFNNLHEAKVFYDHYASVCGFETRIFSSSKAPDGGVIVWRYLVCNREGFKNVSKSRKDASNNNLCKTTHNNDGCINEDADNEATHENESSESEGGEIDGQPSVQDLQNPVLGGEIDGQPSGQDLRTPALCIKDEKQRRRVSNRIGCKARLVLRFAGANTYMVTLFEEKHNHCMASSSSMPFLKVNRKLDIGHQKFFLNCVKANIGTTKCYRLYKETVGGYSNIGATSVDFRNFKRDLKAYIVGVDAQMLVDKLFRKKEVSSAFAFDYDIDESDQLTRIFWADPVCIRNYALFGDAVSFDATYETNRYNMVFAPFTGVDNHNKCVTFAVGLLSKEDVESYAWLFRCFLNAMGREPKCIITDQDPAMKIAIPQVFTTTCHRFCMWHIMSKLSAKVGPVLSKDVDFLNKLNSVVWSHYLQPAEFEKEWNMVMKEYDLLDHSWFTHMFEIRRLWIPGYFGDVFMAGLLRTTSRSESENNFFNEFTNPNFSLIEFYMQFESAMDSQRHNSAQLIKVSESSIPEYKTPLSIERYASFVYNISIFYLVQQEICCACFSCGVIGVYPEDGMVRYVISDERGFTFTVQHNRNDCTTSCTCKNFERIGLLCRHIFFVFKDLKVNVIPDKYVLRRWCKDSILKPLNAFEDNVFQQCVGTEEKKGAIKQLWSDIHFCVGMIEHDPDLFQQFADVIKAQKDLLSASQQNSAPSTLKKDVIKSFYGSSIPTEVSVRPPQQARNKGCGKRIKGDKEKAIEISKKTKRLCRTCNQKVYHDSRNCPLNSEK